ncbi:hypothetical protein IGI04_002529 [Brassica rapa subsp. trilocularis]|uniref:Uncharacterized protein n=1 Tax=Brassica rapa subsp. trilocularis TaxID=1813537 RepID=A0ABQ7NVT1_BRACM|nr:hypothetical protein IGI04_002529 [Brassica rapa subsp. trilocularis]
MDSQGWDPGDLRLQRGNRKVLSGSRRVNLHLHDDFSGGWKRKELMDSRRILWRSGKSRKERQGKSNLKGSFPVVLVLSLPCHESFTPSSLSNKVWRLLDKLVSWFGPCSCSGDVVDLADGSFSCG